MSVYVCLAKSLLVCRLDFFLATVIFRHFASRLGQLCLVTSIRESIRMWYFRKTDLTGYLFMFFIVYSLSGILMPTGAAVNSLCAYNTPCANNSYWCYPNLRGAQPKCHCHTGFTRSTYISHGAWNCIDIDECKEGLVTCSYGSTCMNTQGSYKCQCPPGQVYTGVKCTDLDECATGHHRCGLNTRCINNEGSYRCVCLEPERPLLRSAKTGTFFCESDCHYGDEMPVCSYNAVCMGNQTHFTCQCQHGYHLSVEGICEECNSRDPCHENSEYCTKNGKSRCICKEGFEPDRRVGNYAIACKDIDECADMETCRDTSVCVNTDGGFFCQCPDGYQYVKQRCEKCERRGKCGENSYFCGHDDTVSCVCEEGFIVNQIQGEITHCKDINECDILPSTCGSGTDCINSPGSHDCVCKTGFSHQTGDPDNCQDIDECNGTVVCQGNSSCTNLPGSYNCICHEGYELRGDNCQDIDECFNSTSNSTVCPFGAICYNLMGSYECICSEGFVTGINTTSCEDIDECIEEHGCDLRAECVNMNGTYTCECTDGYTGNGWECKDIDECRFSPNPCSEWADCVNYNATFSCDCPEGFTGTVLWIFAVTHIDECEYMNPCGQNGICRNTNGSFECECEDGFTGDGFNCVDINECVERNVCVSGEECINMIGDYKCEPGKASSTTLEDEYIPFDGEPRPSGSRGDRVTFGLASFGCIVLQLLWS